MQLSTACYIAATCLFVTGSLAELIEKREARAEERATWREATVSPDGKVTTDTAKV